MRILIVTGASGGHIFPAIALTEALKKSGQEVLLVLPQKNRKDDLAVAPEQIKYIPTAVLSLHFNKKNITNFYFFLRGFWESLRIVIQFKPDVAVGFGSLNTLALIFWAWLFRIKTIIHEQNVICGRANKLLAKLVDRVAVSFSQTSESLGIAPEKIVLTGNPLRKDLFRLKKKEALDFFKLEEGKQVVLITGGSQGSHRLNTVCLEALPAYPDKENLQVIHICGTGDFSGFSAAYSSAGLTYKLFDFLPQMQYAYSVADLIICRAGATTIAELQKFRIPAILIPYPFAYAHQLANAQVLEIAKTAWVIQDQELTAEKLRMKFSELFKDAQKLESMRRAYEQFQEQDATQLLAKEVCTLV